MPSNISPSSDREVTVPESGEIAELREVMRTALGDALRARENGGASDIEVRRMLHLACGAARAREMRVEQVLILLKEAWRALPEVSQRRHPEAQAQLARVVTLCIEEYYGAPPRRR